MGKKGDAIDGVLLLDKPEGMSSNWVLQLSPFPCPDRPRHPWRTG